MKVVYAIRKRLPSRVKLLNCKDVACRPIIYDA